MYPQILWRPSEGLAKGSQKDRVMLSLRERAFRNIIYVSGLVLFLVLAVCFTYVLGEMLLSLVGAFLLVIAIFLLIVVFDSWRKAKEE